MGMLENTSLAVQVGTLTLKNPVIIVSGVFGYGDEFKKLAQFNPEDAGAVILKGVSLKPWPGNPPPRIVETAAGMLNSIGLQNIGVERLVEEKLPKWENVDTAVIVNIVGHSLDEYVEVSKKAATSPHISALELNLSCPNIAEGGLAFGTEPEMVKKVTSMVRDVVPDIPLWVKLTPNVADIVPIAQAAVQGGAAAVSMINTVRGMAIDVSTRKPILSNNIGGLSGPAIKPVALLKVAEVYNAFREQEISIPVIGLGGVMTAADVLEFIIAGAAAVGIGTALFYDPLRISQINRELHEFLRQRHTQTGNPQDLLLESMLGTLSWNKREGC